MTNDGGAAFPRLEEVEKFDEDAWRYKTDLLPMDGMSLRDYFAAKAMQGMCSGEIWPYVQDLPEIASRAYLLADAMLAQREKHA